MKNIYFSILCSIVLSLTGCQTPEELVMDESSAGAHGFNVKFSDGSGDFYPEKAAPYNDGDVLTFVVPWFYPEDSNNETDLTKMKLYASLPNNVTVEPGLGGIFDLTKEHLITVISPNGSKARLTVKGERRKSSKKMITEFSLSKGIQGIIFEDKKMIGLISGGLDISNMVPTLKVSAHATVSPDPSLPQDFSKPVEYTVTAHDGSTQKYTVQILIPDKIPYGLRKESAKQLFSIRLSDIGINQGNHWSTGIAVSSKYVFINARNSDLTYVDRFTGKKVGTISLPFKSSLGNFFITNDDHDNLLISNYNNKAGGTLTIYRIKDTAGPEKYIEFKNAPVSGRRMSVTGSLDGDAIIFAPSDKSSNVLYWTVTGGVLKSQEPQVYTADETKIKWNFVADVTAIEKDLNKGLFIAGYGPVNAVGFFNADGTLNTGANLTGLGIDKHVNHALDLALFTGAAYLALGSQFYAANAIGFIFDVTVPSSIGGDNALVYKSPSLPTDNNANSTADIHLKVSADGLKMVLYLFGTNGGVDAYEFDCIDVSKLM